jgi:hypothetical protein
MASKRRYAANNAANNIVGNNPQLPVRITKENKDKAGITTTPPNSSLQEKRREKGNRDRKQVHLARHSQSDVLAIRNPTFTICSFS